MASTCFSSCSFLHYKNSFVGSDHFEIAKAICSSETKKSLVGSKHFGKCKPICSSQTKSTVLTMVEPTIRRSGNYESSIWSYDHIQSLSTKYTGQVFMDRADTLKQEVKKMISESSLLENLLSRLELVDNLQRLGISYHFEEAINDVLGMIYENFYKSDNNWDQMDLNLKALGFRLLRQRSYPVPQEIFRNFRDEIQKLNPCVDGDMVGILNLYEASFHSFEDESILDDARDLTTKYLKANLEKMNESISSLVSHSLEIPLHWRTSRAETRWFIEEYEKRNGMNPILIDLAKLDFDIVQAIHVEDLKDSSRWWRNISWDKKLPFTRDRLVECFMWAVGYSCLPKFSPGRRDLTKITVMITTIDDIYDVYGALDELEQFTDVITRWDINAIQDLPDYMKICFLGFYNTINDITYNALTNSGFLILPYLKKANLARVPYSAVVLLQWAELCKAYLLEARWYHTGYTPTLEEYLENAYVTISCHLILTHIKFSASIGSNEDIPQFLEKSKSMIRYAAIIFRLADDLGTSSEEMARGDVLKAIQCYMNESGATEAEARTYIKELISKNWNKLNKELAYADSESSREFIDFAMNICRIAQFMYSKGDGHGFPYMSKPHAESLLFNPIQG